MAGREPKPAPEPVGPPQEGAIQFLTTLQFARFVRAKAAGTLKEVGFFGIPIAGAQKVKCALCPPFRAFAVANGGSVAKMSDPGERHGQAAGICSGNDFGIAYGSSGLNGGRGAGLGCSQ